MILRIKIILLAFFCIALHSKGFSQETMMNEISPVYLEKLIAVAKENYPKVKSYQTQVEMAKTNIGKQTVSWLDAFSFSYINQPRNNVDIVNPSFLNGYQFGFNLNLGTLLQKPYNVKQAKQQYTVAQNDKSEYDLKIEAEVKTRYYTYIQQLILLKAQTRSLLDAQISFSDIKNKYDKGTVTFTDFNNASLSLTGQTQGKISAEGALLIAKVSLEELLGKRLEEIK